MDNYINLGLIGCGGGGSKVYKVKNLDNNQIYALKKIKYENESEEERKRNLNEIKILKELHHPNLIQFYDSFKEKGKLYIIQEYADGGDLSDKIKIYKESNKLLPENLIWEIFIQLCIVLKYVHSKNILHRDIKCQNVFLMENGIVKLGDFGISKILNNINEFANTTLGTPYFLSPEICMGKEYNYKSDLWMLGCVLYEMACKDKPFKGVNLPNLMINIINQPISDIPNVYSDFMKNLVKKLLDKDMNNRPDIDDILSDNFIKEKIQTLGINVYNYNSNNYVNNQTKININKISPKHKHNNSNNFNISNKKEIEYKFELNSFQKNFSNEIKVYNKNNLNLNNFNTNDYLEETQVSKSEIANNNIKEYNNKYNSIKAKSLTENNSKNNTNKSARIYLDYLKSKTVDNEIDDDFDLENIDEIEENRKTPQNRLQTNSFYVHKNPIPYSSNLINIVSQSPLNKSNKQSTPKGINEISFKKKKQPFKTEIIIDIDSNSLNI